MQSSPISQGDVSFFTSFLPRIVDNIAGGDNMAINPVQIEKFLGGVNYPATKDELISAAKNQGAEEEVLLTLKQMGDRVFQSPTDVTKEVGKLI